MNVLLDLPKELTHMICQSWLHARSLVSLDSAICNKIVRKYLLNDIFKSGRFDCNIDDDCKYSTVLKWVVYKGMKLRNVIICNDESHAIGLEYFRTLGHQIESIQLKYLPRVMNVSSMRILEVIANMCPNLIKFECTLDICREKFLCILNECSQIGELKFYPGSLPPQVRKENALLYIASLSLRSITIIHATHENEDLVMVYSVLYHAAPSLVEHLAVTRADDDIKYQYMQLICRYHNLCTLDLQHSTGISDESLIKLITACTNIKNLNLAYCSSLTDLSGVAIAQNLKRLECIDITWCKFTDVTGMALAEYCAELVEWRVVWCIPLEKAFSMVLTKCQKLRTLHIAFASLRKMDIALLSNITDLYLESIPTKNPTISDKTFLDRFVTIAKSCHSVKNLILKIDAEQSKVDFSVFMYYMPSTRSLTLFNCVGKLLQSINLVR